MIVTGVTATLLAWAASWLIGEATARALFGPRYGSLGVALRLPLGFSAGVCALEFLGFFWPIRVAAWVLVGPAAYGAVLVASRWRRHRSVRAASVVISSFLALGLGLAPVAIAGRFTAAALTNNDGTYYITVADRLVSHSWATRYASSRPDQCLTERVVHWWNWRTGTPNLMAAVSAFSGLDSLEALAVVTALLFALVPCAAIAIARPPKTRTGALAAFAGFIGGCSAAAAFLGYQHMTGHLAAYSIFPLACAAMIGAVGHGGPRRVVYAALLFGAGLAMFADGASVLVLVTLAVFVANLRRLVPALVRTSSVAISTAAIAPFTVKRALLAAVGTVDRAPEKPLFPQRGWLSRSPVDDLATATGVDPWPPWPAAWPSAHAVVEWLGAAAGIALFVLGVKRLRAGSAERRVSALLGSVALVSAETLDVRYLRGKVLLMTAAFAVPLCAAGAIDVLKKPMARWAVLPFLVGELSAFGQLLDPARWKVVDRKAHDSLVPALAALPAGSLVAFDGLGAPADVVLDAHRAERAALLARLRPVQPGLDGGFYLPSCKTAPRPEPLPARAYALQRVSSENLSRGKTIAAWDGFRLLEVDLDSPEGFIAAWAPTHGWKPAEHEAQGPVFRWAEWQAKGKLQVVAEAPCARLKGELRVVRGTAMAGIKVDGTSIFEGPVGADWSEFTTRQFNSTQAIVVGFELTQPTVAPPDPSHALALRNLSVDPVRCGTVLAAVGGDEAASLPIRFDSEVDFSVVPPAAVECGELGLVVTGERGATLRLRIDDGPPTSHYMARSTENIVVPGATPDRAHHVNLSLMGTTTPQEWQLTDVVVRPTRCSR